MISTSQASAIFTADDRFDVPCSNSRKTNPELQQLADYAVYLEDLREEEQRSLARSLHNLIGQSLTSIGLGVEVARLGSENQELSLLLHELKETVRVAADDVRSLLRQLSPAALDDLGVEAALQGLVREAGGTGLDCRFECHLQPGERFDRAIETALFRIVQVCLQNIGRNNGGTAATICLKSEGYCLKLEFAANGGPFVAPPAGLRSKYSGWQGIQRRVELLKGHVCTALQEGEWIRLHVTLPNTMELT